jgi:hypothetical protein
MKGKSACSLFVHSSIFLLSSYKSASILPEVGYATMSKTNFKKPCPYRTYVLIDRKETTNKTYNTLVCIRAVEKNKTGDNTQDGELRTATSKDWSGKISLKR